MCRALVNLCRGWGLGTTERGGTIACTADGVHTRRKAPRADAGETLDFSGAGLKSGAARGTAASIGGVEHTLVRMRLDFKCSHDGITLSLYGLLFCSKKSIGKLGPSRVIATHAALLDAHYQTRISNIGFYIRYLVSKIIEF